MQKKCTSCEKLKDIEAFYKKSNGLYGRHAECKECIKGRDKVIRDKRSEAAKKFKNKKDWIRKKVLNELAKEM